MNNRAAAVTFSLLVHAVAFGVLVFSFVQNPQPLASRAAQPEAVEAVAVDEARVQAEMRRFKSDEQSRRNAETARQKRLQQEIELARKTKEQENQRIGELKKKREQDQRDAEKQRKQLAELKAQQVVLEKEKAALEKKRHDEQERLAQAEKRRKDEEAKAQKVEADRKMREKIAAEDKRLAEEREQRLGRLATQYENDIRNKVQRNWLRPGASTESFQCRLLVQQLPGGEVMSVRVVQSCGSPALDRSVEAAVHKASPLPPPPTPELFDKEINFTFRPR